MHSGQHCPGLVTAWAHGVGGQTRGTQATVPLTHVQRWQGLEEGVKVRLWECTAPSYRHESHMGQQMSDGSGWEHWTGQGFFWQVTASFWPEEGRRAQCEEENERSLTVEVSFIMNNLLTKQVHKEHGSAGEVKMEPDWYSFPWWRQMPVHTGQHCPGGVTGRTQATLGQGTCAHTTPPFYTHTFRVWLLLRNSLNWLCKKIN